VLYKEEIRENPAILKKYILVGDDSGEWLVPLYSCPNYKYLTGSEDYCHVEPSAVAVYEPTGRRFLHDTKRYLLNMSMLE
jgi:hypothetical protein